MNLKDNNMEDEVYAKEDIEEKLLKFIEKYGAIELDTDVEDFLDFLDDERGLNH